MKIVLGRESQDMLPVYWFSVQQADVDSKDSVISLVLLHDGEIFFIVSCVAREFPSIWKIYLSMKEVESFRKIFNQHSEIFMQLCHVQENSNSPQGYCDRPILLSSSNIRQFELKLLEDSK